MGSDQRPTVSERLTSALPLFVLFLAAAFLRRFVLPLKMCYEEMELGELPGPTALLFQVFAHPAFTFVFGPFMLAICYFHFGWVCRNRERMEGIRSAVIVLVAIFLSAVAVSIFLPFVSIHPSHFKK